ncbi:hypothetical protein [Streptomyces sp. NPDC093105]|uniref:hypothetical protein n=1 Tax=Streptomyces sp. NPDC093105 TaxID=3366029 RepID=UPI003821B786
MPVLIADRIRHPDGRGAERRTFSVPLAGDHTARPCPLPPGRGVRPGLRLHDERYGERHSPQVALPSCVSAGSGALQQPSLCWSALA